MSVGVVQAGQLAANKAQAEHTDAKLEEQVGALETPSHIWSWTATETASVSVSAVLESTRRPYIMHSGRNPPKSSFVFGRIAQFITTFSLFKLRG